MNIKFSIIIVVRKLNDFLRENIINLKNLEYNNFEVVIISDFDDAYVFDDDRFKVFVVGVKGPGEKRNIGVKRATGDVVVFLDDDAYPKSDWLNHAADIFADSEIYALGAPAITPLKAKFLERMSGRVYESFLTSYKLIYRHIPSKARMVDDYPAVNLFVRTEAFNVVGGFVTEFWPGEDTKLCLDLIKHFGRDLNYDPRPIVYHHRRDLFLPHLKQVSRYGQHRGQFAKIFPETSLLPSYFMPSLFLLGLFLGPIVAYFSSVLWLPYFGVLIFYAFLILWEALKVAIKERNIFAVPFVFLGIFLTHIVYGFTIIVGLIKRPKLILRGHDSKTGNYLGG